MSITIKSHFTLLASLSITSNFLQNPLARSSRQSFIVLFRSWGYSFLPVKSPHYNILLLWFFLHLLLVLLKQSSFYSPVLYSLLPWGEDLFSNTTLVLPFDVFHRSTTLACGKAFLNPTRLRHHRHSSTPFLLSCFYYISWLIHFFYLRLKLEGSWSKFGISWSSNSHSNGSVL